MTASTHSASINSTDTGRSVLDPSLRLSARFSVSDLMRSDTARREQIDNRPGTQLHQNLQRLAAGLEAIIELLGHPIEISSAYRCSALNTRVGGVPGSQHALGEAADFTCPRFGDALEVSVALHQSAIDFDQCILEFDRWVHVSFRANPRRNTLTIRSASEGYLAGIVDASGTRHA
jgi:hypothetical protein